MCFDRDGAIKLLDYLAKLQTHDERVTRECATIKEPTE